MVSSSSGVLRVCQTLPRALLTRLSSCPAYEVDVIFSLHSMSEETGTEMLDELPKVTQLGSGNARGTWLLSVWAVSHYTHYLYQRC